VVVLVALALGMLLAGFAISSLPGILRFVAFLALLGVGIGFVFWALRRASA
jgi:hypothetical protein